MTTLNNETINQLDTVSFLTQYARISATEARDTLRVLQIGAKIALRTTDLPDSWKCPSISPCDRVMGKDIKEAVYEYYQMTAWTALD